MHLRTLALAAGVALLGKDAWANGRYPSAGQIDIDPLDEQHIVVRATFGLLQSTDGGRTFRWICEQGVGFGNYEDPSTAMTSDGSVIVAAFEGLFASHDRGCEWQPAVGAPHMRHAIDLAVDPGMPSRALAVLSAGADGGGFHATMLQTNDDAKGWSQVGVEIALDFSPLTIEVAPSRPERVYLSGLFGDRYEGAIERTDDRGATWSRMALGLEGFSSAYVSAIDPMTPDVVYLRGDGEKIDYLYVSDDGAESWRLIFSGAGELLGFALSPGGDMVAVGGPGIGLFVANTVDYAFRKVSTAGVRCLAWHPTGLYACADEFRDGFTLGVSADLGTTFRPLYHLGSVSPLACPASTSTGSRCPPVWPSVQMMIEATLSSRDAGDGADTGNAADASGAIDRADAGEPPPGAQWVAGGGSSCALAAVSPRHHRSTVVPALMLAAWIWRRVVDSVWTRARLRISCRSCRPTP